MSVNATNVDPYRQRGHIILYNDADLAGTLIRIGSGSGYSHVAMALGDGNAVQCDARMGGVCIEPAFQERNPRPIGLYPGNIEGVMAWYEKRLAAKDRYDYVGLLAAPLWNLFRVSMNNRLYRWNCATFLAAPMLGDPHLHNAMPNKPLWAYVPADFLQIVGAK